MSQVDNKKLLKTLEDFENNALLSAEIMTENLNKLSENSSKIIQTCKYWRETQKADLVITC